MHKHLHSQVFFIETFFKNPVVNYSVDVYLLSER